MDTENTDVDLAARLKGLDSASAGAPGFGYDTMLERHALRQQRARRRHVAARGTASALVLALLAISVWRLDSQVGESNPDAAVPAAVTAASAPQQRLVRADTYLAVAAIEDHISSIDDELNDARLRGGRDEVDRLELARAELVNSWSQVRYAQMVSANY